MTFQPHFVPAKPSLDPQSGLIGAGIGIVGIALDMQDLAGIQINCALGAKARTFSTDRDVARLTAVEIFADSFPDAVVNTGTQCVANINVFFLKPEMASPAPLGVRRRYL